MEVHMATRGEWNVGRVVASLRQSKDAGYPFDAAWGIALQANPPRASDVASSDGRLFDVTTGETEQTLVDAVYGYCHDAWHNKKPGLGAFGEESGELRDSTQPARRVGSMRRAA
jgi:hypothetical protein